MGMPPYPQFPFPPFPSTGDDEEKHQNMPPYPQFPFPSFPSTGDMEGEQQNMPPYPQFPFPPFPTNQMSEDDQQMLDYLLMMEQEQQQQQQQNPLLSTTPRDCPKVCDLTAYPDCSCLHPAAFTKDGRGNCNVGSIKPDLQVWCYVDPDKGHPEVVCPDAKSSSSKKGYYWSRYACITE